jgi:hypothetical protein
MIQQEKRKNKYFLIVLLLFLYIHGYSQKPINIVYSTLDTTDFSMEDYMLYNNKDTLLFIIDEAVNYDVKIKSIKYRHKLLKRNFYRKVNGTSYVLVPHKGINSKDLLYIVFKKNKKEYQLKVNIKKPSTVYYVMHINGTWFIEMSNYERIMK